jgi:hypothetical protein
MVEWLTLLIRIREVRGSNLSLETGYPNSGFRGFSVPPGQMPGKDLKMRPRPLPYKSFSLRHSLITPFDSV